MALRDDLLILAPEFKDEDDARIDFFLDKAALRVNRRVWGSKADWGTVLLAAHMLTRFAPDASAGSSGQVTMEKVGDLQAQYGVLKMDGDEELSTTTYGAQFAQMRKALRVSPLVL